MVMAGRLRSLRDSRVARRWDRGIVGFDHQGGNERQGAHNQANHCKETH
jgi:hypothetical protein